MKIKNKQKIFRPRIIKVNPEYLMVLKNEKVGTQLQVDYTTRCGQKVVNILEVTKI